MENINSFLSYLRFYLYQLKVYPMAHHHRWPRITLYTLSLSQLYVVYVQYQFLTNPDVTNMYSTHTNTHTHTQMTFSVLC